MFDELRKYTIFLRRNYNLQYKKTRNILSCVFLLLFPICILVDKFLPWGTLFNFIRMPIALLFGVIAYSFSYFMLHKKYEEYNKTKDKIKLFSYRQRVNLTIILVGLSVFAFIFFIQPGIVVYSLLWGLYIMVLLYLATFTKPTREELIQAAYGLEDEKDIKHQQFLKEFMDKK